MDQKIIFISVFNLGCIEIAENHLLSLRNVGITNYMAYVTDKESYDILTNKGYNVIQFMSSELKEKQNFGTEHFNEISYLRYTIINKLLEEGNIVWYLDVDTVVLYNLNNIVHTFIKNKDDIVIQNDINMPCSGCMLFFPNAKTKILTNMVYMQRSKNENDQIILARLLHKNVLNLKLHLLDPTFFPNGLLYFNDRHPDPKFKDLHTTFKNSNNPIYFVHANWMVGIETKINALKEKGLWYI
jgi:hypothetical protein